MNRHLNPSSEAARARLFITDNSSVIVMMAPDFAIKERTYASQRYLIVTCDVQIHGYVYNKAGQGWDGCLFGLCIASFSVMVCQSVWFVGSACLDPRSLPIFHLICLKTLSDQLSWKIQFRFLIKYIWGNKNRRLTQFKITRVLKEEITRFYKIFYQFLTMIKDGLISGRVTFYICWICRAH